MRQRLSPITAAVCALATLVVSLVFGSETYIREVVVDRRGEGNLGVVAQVLGAPNYSRFVGGEEAAPFDRYGFLVVMTLAVGLLVLATVRGANGFLAGWTATVAAGGVAGLVRGLTLADSYYYGGAPGRGGAELMAGFQAAGSGATYGLLIGWGVGLLALVGGLLSRASARSTVPAVPAGTAGPAGWAPAGPPPPVPADGSWSPDRPPPPEGAAAPRPAAPPEADGGSWAAPATADAPGPADEPTRVAPVLPPADRPPTET